MTSAHPVRVYELLAQHRDIGNRMLNLVWLRETLQIAPDEYKLTTNFIRKMIDVAVDQINKHSDLIVSYKSMKTGRAITDFAFKIKLKTLIQSVKL
jgi:plasmid replication initiation protein